MHARRPGLWVLYASGYNQEIVAVRGVLEPGISNMTKPYSGDELLKRIGGLVGQGPGTGHA